MISKYAATGILVLVQRTSQLGSRVSNLQCNGRPAAYTSFHRTPSASAELKRECPLPKSSYDGSGSDPAIA
jgi:hypothetical protein